MVSSQNPWPTKGPHCHYLRVMGSLKLLPSPEVNNRTRPSKHNSATKPVSLPTGNISSFVKCRFIASYVMPAAVSHFETGRADIALRQ